MKKKMNTYPIYETRKVHLQPAWYLLYPVSAIDKTNAASEQVL